MTLKTRPADNLMKYERKIPRITVILQFKICIKTTRVVETFHTFQSRHQTE